MSRKINIYLKKKEPKGKGIFPALFPLFATIFLFLKKNKKDFRYNRGYNSKLEAFSKLLAIFNYGFRITKYIFTPARLKNLVGLK
jgi:hypothetical protein